MDMWGPYHTPGMLWVLKVLCLLPSWGQRLGQVASAPSAN